MTTTITYRKTKTGQWVAFGPVDLVHVGPVRVSKRDGSVKTETVESVGRSFAVGGQQMVYGYLAPKTSSYSTAARRGSGHRRACITGGNCSSFGSGDNCGGYDCDGF